MINLGLIRCSYIMVLMLGIIVLSANTYYFSLNFVIDNQSIHNINLIKKINNYVINNNETFNAKELKNIVDGLIQKSKSYGILNKTELKKINMINIDINSIIENVEMNEIEFERELEILVEKMKVITHKNKTKLSRQIVDENILIGNSFSNFEEIRLLLNDTIIIKLDSVFVKEIIGKKTKNYFTLISELFNMTEFLVLVMLITSVIGKTYTSKLYYIALLLVNTYSFINLLVVNYLILSIDISLVCADILLIIEAYLNLIGYLNNYYGRTIIIGSINDMYIYCLLIIGFVEVLLLKNLFIIVKKKD